MTFKNAVVRLEEWVMDDDSFVYFIVKFGLVFIAPVVLVVAVLAWSFGGPSAMRTCLESGRAWAISGHHNESRWSAATKTTRRVRVTDYGCYDLR